jgi:ABC-type branched-subunit amino acid transport system ATPase component
VSFGVAAGALHGLIGPNGAGKTTTLDALTGFVPHGGRVVFDGRDLGSLAPTTELRPDWTPTRARSSPSALGVLSTVVSRSC